MTKKILVIILILFIIAIVALSCFYYHITAEREFSVQKWDTDIWHRERMVKSLTEKYNLYGMTDEEIVKLLGKNGLVENSHYTYYVGKSYCGPVIFGISFDDNNKVEGYSVIVD